MTSHSHILPVEGDPITHAPDLSLIVPDHPIIPFIRGDGIGPEVMSASQRVWDQAIGSVYAGKRHVHWLEIHAGEGAAALYGGEYLPDETLEVLRTHPVSIKGPLTTPVGGGMRSLNVTLRQELDLYACIRPVRYFDGVPSPMHDPAKTDIVIFRENTEDVYAGIEYAAGTPENRRLAEFLRHEMGASFPEDSGLGIKPMSETGSKRLIRKAIQYAATHRRHSVTLVHKGNIQKYTEGAFRAWGYELAREEFGDITMTEKELWETCEGVQPAGKIVIKDRIADIMFQHLLLNPEDFDVLATSNLNGDYLSDAAAAQVGGVGIAPGVNLGDRIAIFEATHGTAPTIAGQNRANPGSLLLSGVMMFEHIGWQEAADAILKAFEKTLKDGRLTEDLASQHQGITILGTAEFASAVIDNL